MSNKKARLLWGRRLGGTLAALGLAAGGAIALAAPAQAAPGDCTLGHTCLYSGYGYGNDWAQNPGTLQFGSCIDDFTQYGYNDIASSVFDNGRYEGAWLYENVFEGGYRTYIYRNTGISDLGTIGWNDRTSSAYFEGSLGSVKTSTCN